MQVGWPLVAVSAVAGVAALLTTALATFLAHHAAVRPLGAVAVAAVLAGWGVAQYPYLLGSHLDLHAAAAPQATLAALGVVTVVAVMLVVPSLAWLLWLTHRGALAESGEQPRT